MLIIENYKEGRSCNLNTIQTIEGEIISSISQPVQLVLLICSRQEYFSDIAPVSQFGADIVFCDCNVSVHTELRGNQGGKRPKMRKNHFWRDWEWFHGRRHVSVTGFKCLTDGLTERVIRVIMLLSCSRHQKNLITCPDCWLHTADRLQDNTLIFSKRHDMYDGSWWML